MLKVAFPRLEDIKITRPLWNLLRAIVDNSPQTYSGPVDPNNYQTGDIGDLYINTSGGAGNTLWVKESGNGTNTGWAAK